MSRLIAAALLSISLLSAGPRAVETPLDRYVHAPDDAFAWEHVRDIPGDGFTLGLFELTSQRWAPPEAAAPAVWKHWLLVYRPAIVENPTGFLFITGGSNDGKAPDKADGGLGGLARQTRSVVAELKMVPNQPLVFDGDGKARYEDSLIAYNWRRFLDTRDAQWLTRLPMTKAAVRAMDALGQITADFGPAVERFVVAGASKRGWTAWTTAAADDRVVAVAPIVIDLLNIVPSFVHHYRVYGFWAPAVKDYYEEGIMDRFREPEYGELLAIVEPYSYRERLTMPKFLVNSAGDQFFLPDSSQFYFDDLPGEKYLRYIPNSDHSLRGTDALESLGAFYEAVLAGKPRPRFGWRFEADGSIRVRAQDKPSAVRLWSAHNPRHRDFRLESVGPIYRSEDLAPQADGSYVARVASLEGFTAYFVELEFPSGGKAPFKFTTAVRVAPDVYPNGEPEAGKTRVGPKRQ